MLTYSCLCHSFCIKLCLGLGAAGLLLTLELGGTGKQLSIAEHHADGCSRVVVDYVLLSVLNGGGIVVTCRCGGQ